MSKAADRLIERIAENVISQERIGFLGKHLPHSCVQGIVREALAEYESSQWVDVRERLPKRNKDVFVYAPRWSKDGITTARLEAGNIWSLVNDCGTDGEVTYWRERPAPPVIAQKENL